MSRGGICLPVTPVHDANGWGLVPRLRDSFSFSLLFWETCLIWRGFQNEKPLLIAQCDKVNRDVKLPHAGYLSEFNQNLCGTSHCKLIINVMFFHEHFMGFRLSFNQNSHNGLVINCGLSSSKFSRGVNCQPTRYGTCLKFTSLGK